MNIYIGNLAYSVNEEKLREVFSAYGEVSRVNVIKDKMSGRSKGFAFVEMPNADEANAAISGLNEKDVNGRNIKVNEARPKEEKSSSQRFQR